MRKKLAQNCREKRRKEQTQKMLYSLGEKSSPFPPRFAFEVKKFNDGENVKASSSSCNSLPRSRFPLPLFPLLQFSIKGEQETPPAA